MRVAEVTTAKAKAGKASKVKAAKKKVAKKAATSNGKSQTEIPGTERKTIKKLDNAIMRYLYARDKRIDAKEKETLAQDELRSHMKAQAREAKVAVEKFVYKFVDGEAEHTARVKAPGDPTPTIRTRDLSA